MDICRRQFGLAALAGLAVRPDFALTPRPKLLVLVLLGPLRSDVFAGVGPQLAAGGFRRLIEKGAYFHNCVNAASTWPAAALATAATGSWPSQHGIVADSWYDRTGRAVVTASDEALMASTLAAEIAAAPRTRVYVMGMESAHARIFAGGSAPSVFWMNDDGRFVSRGGAPSWLDSFNSRPSAPESLHDARWPVLGGRRPPESVPPLRVLQYDSARPRDFMALYKASPFAQTALFDLAGELITREQLGQKDTFDFVCVLGGATTRLGYETGARSPLMDQMVLSLDRSLEALLTLCSRAAPAGPGDGNFNLVLAGTHGAPVEPSDASRPRMAVNGETVAQAIEHELQSGGLGHVQKYVYPFLYLDTSGFRDPEEVRGAAARAAMKAPAVAGYYTAGGACSVHGDWQHRFANSFHPRHSGDLMLAYRDGYVEEFGRGRGISYGSLYNYDAFVPLCLYGPQFAAGSYENTVELVDVAPTLARVSDVDPPSSSTGRVLTEALAE